MAARSHGAIQPGRLALRPAKAAVLRMATLVASPEPSERRLSKKDTFTASAFLIFYLAAYLAAGYAGVTFVEWAWMRIFG